MKNTIAKTNLVGKWGCLFFCLFVFKLTSNSLLFKEITAKIQVKNLKAGIDLEAMEKCH